MSSSQITSYIIKMKNIQHCTLHYGQCMQHLSRRYQVTEYIFLHMSISQVNQNVRCHHHHSVKTEHVKTQAYIHAATATSLHTLKRCKCREKQMQRNVSMQTGKEISSLTDNIIISSAVASSCYSQFCNTSEMHWMFTN